MNWIHAVILGIVQGITEFLPISSTGHLILASHILKIPGTEFLKSFEIIIQLGSILAVLALFWKRLFREGRVFQSTALAFLPTAVIGFAAYGFVKHHLLGNAAVVVWSLFTGGVVITAFEYLYSRRKAQDETTSVESIGTARSLLIGVIQSIAMIPGVSRSGATIIGGLTLNLPRRTIVEFSFLLAIPTMLAATSLDLVKNAGQFSYGDFGILTVGFTASFLTSFLTVKWFMKFISTSSFFWFGIYRIAAAITFWFVFLRS